MDSKEILNQLESYAVASGYLYQHFYQDGWQFTTTELDQGFEVFLNYFIAGKRYQITSSFFSQPHQATLIRMAIELMRQATGNTSDIQCYSSASDLASALESQIDRVFPGNNYAFGYFYREGWSFVGEDTPEGYKIWLNFVFDSGDYKQTSSYILPSALTQSELEGWTKTIMNEAFAKR